MRELRHKKFKLPFEYSSSYSKYFWILTDIKQKSFDQIDYNNLEWSENEVRINDYDHNDVDNI